MNIDYIVSADELKERGIELSNPVGSLRVERQLDLRTRTTDLDTTDYRPETYPILNNLKAISSIISNTI